MNHLQHQSFEKSWQWHKRKTVIITFKVKVKLCPTLCDPMDYSLQASLSMGFSRQEYWSGLPFPSPGDLPDPGIEPRSGTEPMSSTLQAFTTPNFEIYNTKVLKSHDIKEKLWSLHLKQTAIILLKSKAWKFKGHICIDSTIIPSSFFLSTLLP